MIKNSVVKKILAVSFVAMLFIGFLRSDSLNTFLEISSLFNQKEASTDSEEEGLITLSDIEGAFTDKLLIKDNLIDLNGSFAKKLKMQGYYSDMGMYVTDDNYIVSASDATSTDYEFMQLVQFRDFLEENNISFMYVNKPTKYTDDSLFEKEFGVKTYCNQNADKLLERLEAMDINVLDLRQSMAEEGIKDRSMFYRTDHHWTAPAALWATKKIAEGLNEKCGYSIDTSIFDEENFIADTYKECWLGEQGRKISKAYVGLDDYTKLLPINETSYLFKDFYGNLHMGEFDYFINEAVYNLENDVYENESWHYSYVMHDCINNFVDEGKVLLIGDSYDFLTQPFLSLGLHEIDGIILRYYEDDFDLKQYILDNHYDTVIVAYAEFIIGSRDDEENGNYRMFKLN